MKKKIPDFQQSPYEYVLIISIKKRLIPLIGKPFKIRISIKNASKKIFSGDMMEYLIVEPVPFALDYDWNKLNIPQLNDKEEIKIEEFYYPTSGGEREIKFRTINKKLGLCMPSKGAFPWLFGNELRVPFRVYSRIEIIMLIGAISAIIAAILSGIMLF